MHLVQLFEEHRQRIRLLDDPRSRAEAFELRALGAHTRKDDHRHRGGNLDDHVAAGALLEAQVDDRRVGLLLAQEL
jgi:hypothetical protein